jgi:hypothetical protein
LKEFARAWPAGGQTRPLPLYYLRGQGDRPHPSLPEIPKFWEGGLLEGQWDRQRGLNFSARARIGAFLGLKLLEYDPNKFLSDEDQGL